MRNNTLALRINTLSSFEILYCAKFGNIETVWQKLLNENLIYRYRHNLLLPLFGIKPIFKGVVVDFDKLQIFIGFIEFFADIFYADPLMRWMFII